MRVYRNGKNTMENDMKHHPTVTRVEYVEKNGRRHVITHEAEGVKLAFQDDDRTLKVFIEGEKK